MPNTISIAYLGPCGTYSHEAAQLFADKLVDAERAASLDDIEFVECPSFNTVFESVDRGKTTYGVVPTENSLEGAVTSTLDNFAFSSNAVIVGQLVLPIHHCLIMHPHAHRDDIERVASHAQGLAQCRRYLMANMPTTPTFTTSSTAESAQMAAGDIHTAAIANAYAAQYHGAVVVEHDIEDHLGNETSFVLIAPQGTAPVLKGEKYKTSLALFMNQDKPGTLQMILSEFAYASVNLTMIQSRPTKQGLGDYMFFVDIEGRDTDPDVQMALNCLKLKLREVKVLGSFPI